MKNFEFQEWLISKATNSSFKLIDEKIELDLAKDLRSLEVICSYKIYIFAVTSKIKKKIKHEEFRVSRKIDEQDDKFKL